MAALSEAASAFHNPSRPKPWSLLTADKDATRIKKTARALLRAAFINGCRFRFHRYIPMDEQRKGFVVGLRKALGACPNSRCSILSESDSTLGYEQVFSPLEYR
jgi:hypothetical protein